MPCRNDWPDEREVRRTDELLKERLAKEFAESIACALLTALEGVGEGMTLLDDINYQEAGFKRVQLERWWKRHKKLDCERREREAKAKKAAEAAAAKKSAIEQLRKNGMAKLTRAEAEALGLV